MRFRSRRRAPQQPGLLQQLRYAAPGLTWLYQAGVLQTVIGGEVHELYNQVAPGDDPLEPQPGLSPPVYEATSFVRPAITFDGIDQMLAQSLPWVTGGAQTSLPLCDFFGSVGLYCGIGSIVNANHYMGHFPGGGRFRFTGRAGVAATTADGGPFVAGLGVQIGIHQPAVTGGEYRIISGATDGTSTPDRTPVVDVASMGALVKLGPTIDNFAEMSLFAWAGWSRVLTAVELARVQAVATSFLGL